LYIQKKKINFSNITDVKKNTKGLLIGPGASGKTKLLHEIYNINIEYKAPDIIKNKVTNEDGKSLKFGKNTDKFDDRYPIAYIAPNYNSIEGYKPNIDAWIELIKESCASAIVCYIKPHTHRLRLKNRIMNKGTPHPNQHTDNYPFSYQNLFYKLDKQNIEYCVINTQGNL